MVSCVYFGWSNPCSAWLVLIELQHNYWSKFGSFLKTFDGVNSWIKLNSETNNDLNSVYFTDATTGCASGSKGTIVKTTDAGKNWHVQQSGTTVAMGHIFFLNSSFGYAGGGSGTILKTTNCALPVELVSFTGKFERNALNVFLVWLTASETKSVQSYNQNKI